MDIKVTKSGIMLAASKGTKLKRSCLYKQKLEEFKRKIQKDNLGTTKK